MRLSGAQMEELRELLMTRWDPIGVHVPEAAVEDRACYWDEYDDYLPTIAALLKRREGVDVLQGYLEELRTREMGLPPCAHLDADAAEAIVDWHRRAQQD